MKIMRTMFLPAGIFNEHAYVSAYQHGIRETDYKNRFSFNVFSLMMDNIPIMTQHYLNLLRIVIKDSPFAFE